MNWGPWEKELRKMFYMNIFYWHLIMFALTLAVLAEKGIFLPKGIIYILGIFIIVPDIYMIIKAWKDK